LYTTLTASHNTAAITDIFSTLYTTASSLPKTTNLQLALITYLGYIHPKQVTFIVTILHSTVRCDKVISNK